MDRFMLVFRIVRFYLPFLVSVKARDDLDKNLCFVFPERNDILGNG